ncbi:M15 family metallopeptidase [Laspinema olomoucense]|uniref:M15 family metallopeptidase n=1 Tax=Laspinema olomoucense TaxID=3231600 RepID=UPI0021BB85A5|nr:M15 family metallopeptidase [Laspinema sp. D3a]
MTKSRNKDLGTPQDLPGHSGTLRPRNSYRTLKRKQQLARRRFVFSFLSSLILTFIILLAGINLIKMIAGSPAAMQKWDVAFINVDTSKIAENSGSYFREPVANVVALIPQSAEGSLLRFYADSQSKNFLPSQVQQESFTLRASTKTQLKAKEIYTVENKSTGLVELEIQNTETGVSNPYLIWDGGQKRDRFLESDRKFFFEVQESGLYDIRFYYFQSPELARIDITLENPPIPDNYDELYRYYGDPLDPEFGKNYIVTIGLKNPNGGEWKVECHKAIAERLRQVWEELINGDNLHLIQTYNGCLNIRMKRGKNEPSVHSWGLAIDVNAEEYPLGSPKQQPEVITQAFKNQGLSWGGYWKSRKDPMHYEFSVSGI